MIRSRWRWCTVASAGNSTTLPAWCATWLPVTRRAGVVGAHLDFMMTALHYHHHAEDTVVWPRLASRAPSRTTEVSRMEDAHRAIADTGGRVRDTMVQWAKGGDRRLAGQLVPLMEEFAGRVDEHFDDEERDVVPLIAEHLAPREWRKFLAHGSAFLRAPRGGTGPGRRRARRCIQPHQTALSRWCAVAGAGGVHAGR